MGRAADSVARRSRSTTNSHLRSPSAPAVGPCKSFGRFASAILPGNSRLAAMQAAPTLDAFLSCGGIDYHAPADAAKTTNPSGSVDVYFSYAVLEHVPEHVIDDMIKEAKRVLSLVAFSLRCRTARSLCRHEWRQQGQLSSVPEWLWAALVKNKFSYHNRLRERDFLERLGAAGAIIVDVQSRTDQTT